MNCIERRDKVNPCTHLIRTFLVPGVTVGPQLPVLPQGAWSQHDPADSNMEEQEEQVRARYSSQPARLAPSALSTIELNLMGAWGKGKGVLSNSH